MIKIGSNEVTLPYSKMYLGSTLVWQNTPPAPTPASYPDWLEATGTQYIDTQYELLDTDTVEIEFALTDTSQSTTACLCGRGSLISSSPVNGTLYDLYRANGTKYAQWGSGRGQKETTTLNTPDLLKHTLKDTRSIKTITFDGTDITYTRYSYADYLFAEKYTDLTTSTIEASHFIKAKIYSFKVTDASNNVVLDLVPVVDTNGDVGMYDSVSGTIFYNAGTGTFLYGNDT